MLLILSIYLDKVSVKENWKEGVIVKILLFPYGFNSLEFGTGILDLEFDSTVE